MSRLRPRAWSAWFPPGTIPLSKLTVRHFTQQLVDHYNPSYFERIRARSGHWLSNQYLGSLKQGRHCVHLWRSRFEHCENDALFSLTLTADGMIAGLLKRFAKV